MDDEKKLSTQIERNIEMMKGRFPGDKTIVSRRIKAMDGKVDCCLYFVDGMVDSMLINKSVIQPIAEMTSRVRKGAETLGFLAEYVIQANEIRCSESPITIIDGLLSGDCILFCDGSAEAIIIGSKGFVKRGITEPDGEIVLKGPREGFIEPLIHNLALLRRRLHTSDLRVESIMLGDVTRTSCCIVYIDGVVDRDVLDDVRGRVKGIKIDGILDSHYITELISDYKQSLIKTIGTTERPDVVAAKLLEGRVAILVDGSPVALTLPYIFIENFHTPEDFYVHQSFANFNRILRVVGFILSISLVPCYVALTTFNHEFLPTSLLLFISVVRQGVVLPTIAEAVLLLLAFDILREAGARAPSSFGQTLSIVGGIVVGQAAVEARFVSAPMLIIVAFTGCTGLVMPEMKSVSILYRDFLLIMVMLLGIHGYLLGAVALLAELSQKRSFGVAMMSGMAPLARGSYEDSYTRETLSLMKHWGRFLSKRKG